MAERLDTADLFTINDMVTAYAANAGLTWSSEEEEDRALNDATHAIAAILNTLGAEN